MSPKGAYATGQSISGVLRGWLTKMRAKVRSWLAR